MSDNNNLFRDRSIKHRKELNSIYGNVILFFPKTYYIIVLFIIFTVVIVLFIIFFGNYSRKVTVSGEVTLDKGIVPIYLPSNGGRIKKYYYKEGDIVKKNDPLVDVSNEISTLNNENYYAEKNKILISKLKHLENRIKAINLKEKLENSNNIKKVNEIKNDINSIEKQIKLNEINAKKVLHFVNRYEKSSKEGVISESEYLNKFLELSGLKEKILDLERQLLLSKRNLNDLYSLNKTMPIENENEKNSLNFELVKVKEEILNNNYEYGVIVKSPISGVIHAVQGFEGLRMDSSKPVFLISPEGYKTEVSLFVTSSSIGNIKIGDKVKLKFEAFPYQKYGFKEGKIRLISKYSLTPDDLLSGPRHRISEPTYLVKVSIDSDFFKLDAEKYDLLPGMMVEADILLENYYIYELLTKPFKSIRDNL